MISQAQNSGGIVTVNEVASNSLLLTLLVTNSNSNRDITVVAKKYICVATVHQ